MNKSIANVTRLGRLNSIRSAVGMVCLIPTLALSAGVAHASISPFSGGLPPGAGNAEFGPWTTDRKQPPPTDQIRIRMTSNVRDVYVRAVACEDVKKWLGPSVTIPANSRELYVLATKQPKKKCFRIQMGVPGIRGLGTVSGRVSY